MFLRVVKSGLIFTLCFLSTLLADDVNGIKVTDVSDKYEYSVKRAKVGDLVQSINLGFANTTGNTNTLNFNGKYTFDYARKGYRDYPFHVGLNVSAFRTEDKSKTTNEEYTAKFYLDQDLQSDWLVYTFVNWLRNEFRNFENKWITGAGVGKVLLDEGTHFWRVKVGAAYNREEYSNAQDTDTYTSLTQYLEYKNRINKTSKFYMHVGASENFEDMTGDYELAGVIGLDFVISEDLHVIIEEEIIYDALPPIGFKKTDTKSIIRIGYSF